MSAADQWCAGWYRDPHVPDVAPVPVDGGPARLCGVCDRKRRQDERSGHA